MQERVSPDIVRAAQAGLIDAGIVAGDVLRRLRRRIQVGNFETACRMIEAKVGVLPEGTARRHANTMAPRLVALEDDRAERRLQICSPISMRLRVSRAISPACSSRTHAASRTDSHAFERQSAVCAPIAAASTWQTPLHDFV